MAKKYMKTARLAGVAVGVLAMAALAAPLAAQPAVLGDSQAACAPGATGTAVLATVHGFKDRKGRLRLQNYRGTAGEYLETGKFLRREEVPVTTAGEMTFCLPLPGPGRYVLVALHDRDINGKLSPFSDGIGFTKDPKLGLSKPPAEKTVMDFGPGLNRVRIALNYLRGFSVRPLPADQVK